MSQIDSKQIADVQEALSIWIDSYLTERPDSQRLVMVATPCG